MGFFSKLFSKKQANETESLPDYEQPKSSATFMLLFDAIPKFSVEVLNSAFKLIASEDLSSLDYTYEEETLIIIAKFGEDEVIISSLNTPYPNEVLDRVLPVCHYDKETKQTFYTNQAHMIFVYKSDSTPIFIRYDRLFSFVKVINALSDNIIGIVNESAWTAFPQNMFNLVSDERDELYQQQAMPFVTWMLWTGGCVKYVLDNSTIWHVTKGHHLFGIPELAFKGKPEQGEFAMRIFNAFFSYMYFYQAKFSYGHTAELGSMHFRIKKPYEYLQIFESNFPTLVLEVK